MLSINHCSLTFGDADTCMLKFSAWCILHFSPTLVAQVPHRVDKMDDPSLWNSGRTSSQGGVERYSREKDHPSHQLYEGPGAESVGEKWRIQQALIVSIHVHVSASTKRTVSN